MTTYFRSMILSSLLFSIFLGSSSSAVVLSPENSKYLCEEIDVAAARSGGLPLGTSVVSYRRLADEVVAAADVRYWLLRAVRGTPPGASDAERAVEVLRLALTYVNPIFDEPVVAGFSAEEIRAERLRAEEAIEIEVNEIDGLVESQLGDTLSASYTIRPEEANAADLFPSDPFDEKSEPRAFLECRVAQPIAELQPPTQDKPIVELEPETAERLAAIAQRFLLRGRRDDLMLEEVGDATTANFSYLQDDNADSSTLSADGFVGLKLRDRVVDNQFGIPRVVAYVGYNRIENDKASEKDTDVVTPGVAARLDLPVLDLGSIELFGFGSMYGELIDDREQEAQQSRFGLNWTPLVAYDETFVTGRYYTIINGLEFRPVVSFDVTGSHVIDDGNSPELEGASDFVGFGGKVIGRLRILPLNPIFTNFLAETGWTYRNYAVGDLRNKQVHRFVATLAYVFPKLSNVQLNLTYENGENLETFQDEEFYKISFGVKF